MARPPKPFDVAATPLQSGCTLIEASAGTGKTYTIAALVLRLIIENGLFIEQILVSTYTELATAELRNRIRTLLRDALTAFHSDASDDALLGALLARHRPNSAQIITRLEDALRSFDEAAIFTIHGFCQRLLRDRAFESGTLFDAELIADQSHILRAVADDFWRRHFYDSSPVIAALAQRAKLGADRFFDDAVLVSTNAALRVIGAPEQSFELIKLKLNETWNELRSCWEADSSRIRGFFANNAWAKYLHGDAAKMTELLDDLGECLASGGTADQLSCVEKFATSLLVRNTRKGQQTPRHRFFELCEVFLTLEREFASAASVAFMEYARAEVLRAKTGQNVFSFDDLLTRVQHALSGPRGEPLAALIRGKYRAALIDEFQDTDPIQYGIFQKIYSGSDAPLFFIGDPKQAIYSFRGADVFTYLTAAESADRVEMLGENWRSETGLVEAVNALFASREDNPFAIDRIRFEPVKSFGRRDKGPLITTAGSNAPLHIWLTLEEDGISNARAEALLPKAVAAEIARLLQGGATIGDRPLRAGDIAILISQNREGPMLQNALTDLNLPSVLYSSASVFESRDAAELARILEAVAEPGYEKRVRAALATDALGLNVTALDALTRDEREWERRLLSFQRYHELWNTRGFVQMCRTILRDEKVRARLLKLPDGERRLTNLLQLIEVLHHACAEQRLGMTGLLKWFGQRRADKRVHDEAHEQRLERDDEAIRVVTVHKSKGLEYGVVFCPFAWRDAELRGKTRASFHDAQNGLTLDLGSSDLEANLATALEEQLAERLRQFYVAMTRARHRCHLVWGNFNHGQKSPPAWLLTDLDIGAFLHPPSGSQKKTPAEPVRAACEKLRAAHTAVLDLPSEIATPCFLKNVPASPLEPRVFSGEIDRSWGISSFTSLTAGREPELPDYDIEDDAETAAREIETPASGMFAFPRGTEPGTCLHHIFEEIDFADLREMPEVVRRKLEAFGIRGHDETVCDLIRKVVVAPLDPARPQFTLSRVPLGGRIAELEFYFPIRAVTPARIARLITGSSSEVPGQMGRLHFAPASGFMKGFIDLVFEFEGRFYFIDWKSNWLGNRLSAYDRGGMAAEMARKHYTLQLHLYAVALHRYLRQRLPGYDYEQHFGGAIYVFLRGVDPTRPECGIHRERPTAQALNALSEELEKPR